jgi:hypothetical protein
MNLVTFFFCRINCYISFLFYWKRGFDSIQVTSVRVILINYLKEE